MNRRRLCALAATLSVASATHATEIDLVLIQALTQGPGGARPGSAEILGFTTDQNTVVSTMDGADGYGVQILTLGTDGRLTERGLVDFGSVFGSADPGEDAISATAPDPLGRGFGVVGLIPEDNGGTFGKIGFYDYRSGISDATRVLLTLDVGYHPDNVRFSASGTQVFIADEGEFTSGGDSDAPGSLSIVDLTSVNSIDDITSLTVANVQTYDFQPANLGPGVDLSGLRYNDRTFTSGEEYRHVEPEYIAEKDGLLYVTLQENNAVGVFDLTSRQWTDIQPLGTITQTVDASDEDGPGGSTAALIDDPVNGMPMPDSIATFEVGGQVYYVTANEGDFRVDDGDRVRVKDLDPTKFSMALQDALKAQYGTVAEAVKDENLGRLRVEDLDGIYGTSNTQTYDDLRMPGTRSFSIWNATTGDLVSDTESLETILLLLDPALHNIDDGLLSEYDQRSDDKGPEPEALTVFELVNRWFAVVGMERQNGLLLFDITDPTKPAVFEDYINSLGDGLVAPESLLFISADDSPTGFPLILAGYEGASDTNGIGVYRVRVPAPASALLLLPGLLLLARRRKG
jgi:hypothetical protein